MKGGGNIREITKENISIVYVKDKKGLNKYHVCKEGEKGSCCCYFNLGVKSVTLNDSLKYGLGEKNEKIKNNPRVFQRQYCFGLVSEWWQNRYKTKATKQ